MMNAASFALALLTSQMSQTSIDKPAPVQLLPFRCPELTDRDVRPPLTVELRDRLLAEGAPLPPDAVAVSTSCQGAEVVLSASRPGFASPAFRHVPLSNVQAAARPRAVALTIAELVRPVRRDGAPVTATVSEPVASSPAEGTFWVATEVAPVLGAYASAVDSVLLGAQLRVAMGSGPAAPPSPRWSFGGACDLSINGPSNAILQKSLGAAFIARRRGARLGSELGLGARVGNVELDGGPGIGKQTNVWGGAFGSAALLLQINKPLAIRAAVELGFPIEGPGFGFHGPWAVASLGTSVVF